LAGETLMSTRSIEDDVLDEDIAFLRSMGVNDDTICRRLGISQVALEQRDRRRERSKTR
jgi:hypothetical protein